MCAHAQMMNMEHRPTNPRTGLSTCEVIFWRTSLVFSLKKCKRSDRGLPMVTGHEDPRPAQGWGGAPSSARRAGRKGDFAAAWSERYSSSAVRSMAPTAPLCLSRAPTPRSLRRLFLLRMPCSLPLRGIGRRASIPHGDPRSLESRPTNTARRDGGGSGRGR